jgi:hypothetical protein
MGILTWLNGGRHKVDVAVANFFQKRMNKKLLYHRKVVCMMATIFPWYEKLADNVNNYLAGKMDESELRSKMSDYTYRFGSQYKYILKELKVLETKGWTNTEIASRKNQSTEEQEHIRKWQLSKKFLYAIEDYFDRLNKLVLDMEIVLNQGNQRKLVKLVEKYLLELKVYQKFCKKYVKEGICGDISIDWDVTK